jgi:hypothetical protein
LLCAPLLAARALPARAQTLVADVKLVIGAVSARAPAAEARPLKTGDPVFLHDTLTTGAPDGTLLLAFRDGTSLALGPGSQMLLARYSAGPESPSFLAEIARGVFRVATGAIARLRAREFRVVTPTATIGIRGTQFGGETDGVRALVVLFEPERGSDVGAIVVSNPFGSVDIDQPGYGTEIPDAASPPSPPRRMQLRAVDNLIRSLSTLQRLQLPRLPR